MKYTKEQKLAWVEAYREGRLGASMTPPGIKRSSFVGMVSRWARMAELHGPGAVDCGGRHREYPAAFKLAAARRVEAGESESEVARSLGMANASIVCQWAKAYRKLGPEGLESKPKGRRPGMARKKRKPSRDEELEYLRAENAYLKKYLELLNRRTAPAGSRGKPKPSGSSGAKGTD